MPLMRLRLMPLLAAAALLFAAGPAFAAPPTLTPALPPAPGPIATPAADAPWGPEVDGLQCRLTVLPDYCLGQTVSALVEIRNASARTRYLLEIFEVYCKGVAATITGPGGEPHAKTAEATRSFTPDAFKPLAPGEVRRIEIVDLRDTYSTAFRKAGAYTVTYSYRGQKCPARVVVGSKGALGAKREPIYSEASPEKIADSWAGLLVSNPATVRIVPAGQADLEVHEWGVFTLFNDLQVAREDRRAEWGGLPDFFYRQLPERRLRWAPAGWNKPIIYFYTSRPGLGVKVEVGFGDGLPVVWWPACAAPLDDTVRAPATPAPRPPVFRFLTWEATLGDPTPAPGGGSIGAKPGWVKATEFPLPDGCWLKDARLPAAAPVTVTGSTVQRGAPWLTSRQETERFLYYDGLVPAPDYLRCRGAGTSDVTLRNAAAFAVGPVFVIDRRLPASKAPIQIAVIEKPIAPGEEVTVPLKEVPAADWPGAAVQAVRQALTAAGLTAAETDSLLRIWHKGFFEQEGLTVFYPLPPTEYNRLLPLKITPKPGRLMRVGVAIHPQMQGDVLLEQKVRTLVTWLDSEEPSQREEAARQLTEIAPVAARFIREAVSKLPGIEARARGKQILDTASDGDWLREALEKPGAEKPGDAKPVTEKPPAETLAK